MPGQTLIVAGPARSGKTGKLLARYRTALAEGSAGVAAINANGGTSPGVGETLWIAPTARAAAVVRERLLAGGFAACFAPNVYTFEAFAQTVLDHAPDLVRPLYGMARRQLIARLAEDLLRAGRLRYFSRIADTPGFADLLSGFLSEMKRHEIWPEDFRAACERRGLTAKDEELFAFYDAYQDVLARRQLFDAEGRFWTARTLLGDGHRRPFDRLRLVAVDGFADFTATQHDILGILVDYADELIVSLPLERDLERRGDLFAKPRATLEELSRRLPDVRVEWIERTPDVTHGDRNWSAMDRLERYLLGDPREALPPLDIGDGIEIVAAAQQLDELQSIASRIKQLLLDGDMAETTHPRGKQPRMSVQPQDIAVVFRSTDAVAALVREVFEEYGLPFAIDCRPLLGESPQIKALLAALALDGEDWPFRRVLAVLGNNFIAPPMIATDVAADVADVHVAAERVVRSMQIPSGRSKLLERWRRMAVAARETNANANADEESANESPDDDHSQTRRRTRRNRAAAESLSYVEAVAAAVDELPQRATPVAWAGALERFSLALGMTHSGGRTPIGAAPIDRTPSIDDAAWRRLLEVLRAGSRLSQWLDEPAQTWNRCELLAALDDIVAAESIPVATDETGRIRVLSAPAARTLSIPYLFVASLAEHEFPRRARDEVMYHEADRRRLAEEGLRLPQRSERASEEMLLFYEVVTRATRRLVLSYPAMNEKAEPLLPSPFLVDVQRILPAAVASRSDVSDMRPIPRAAAGYSPADRRVLAMHEALTGNTDRLATLVGSSQGSEQDAAARFDSVAANVIAALRTNDSRKGERFGPMDGMFASAAAKYLLAERYGADRVWSASQFEAYAYCPMRYFFEYVLHLEAAEGIELATDSRQRGRLLHAALAGAHRELNAARDAHSSPLDATDAFRRGYDQQLTALAEQFRRDTELDAVLMDIDAKMLADLIDQYVEQHGKYDALPAALRPAHFEVSFGFAIEDDSLTDPLSTPTPLVLRRGDEEIRIGGRIDRIDMAVEGETDAAMFGIVDYKTGNPIKKKSRAEMADDGRRLQLDLYALAVEQVLLADRSAIGVHSGYWHVAANGFDVWQSMHEASDATWWPTEDWTRRRVRLVELVFSLVRGIRDGQFPVYCPDEECTKFCAFKTVCRVHQARSLEKSWQPPASK
ncbi:MAG: PD-(D/E)XK nuclease family protein [Pirellulales bacterium]